MSKEIFLKTPVDNNGWKWIWTGLVIRLLVMPFTTHSDLLSVYYRAHLFLEGRPLQAFGPSLFNSVHGGYLWLIKPLIPYSTMWGSPGQNSYSMVFDWLTFVNSPVVFRQLFLFKLPYLGFEILAVWVLLKLIKPEQKASVLAFWMLNPVVIFSTYIFGRFDIIIVFLILSALYLAKEERPNLALIVLGLAVLLRVYPVILILPFALILKREAAARVRLALLGFLPFALSVAAGAAQGEAQSKALTGMQHMAYPLAMKFSLGTQDNLYVFVFLYSLIVMYLYVNPREGVSSLKRFGFYIVILFFATSFFHPHYFLWLVPFSAFYFNEPQFKPIYWVQVGTWMTYTFQWGRSLAGYLIAPLSPAFFWTIMSPSEWIEQYYPAVQVIGISRSLFSATCLAMAYIVWRRCRGGSGDILNYLSQSPKLGVDADGG
jgi:hypothetical protein